MLTVDSVNLHYGAAQALKSVSLTAKIGEVTCVLGRNGVGKTSLMRAIVGQQRSAPARFSLNGERMDALKRRTGPGAASPSCRRAARSSRF